MKFLSIFQVLELYRQIMIQSGGTFGIRDIAGLESSLAQPQITFNEKDLYPSLIEKAAALAFSLIKNHPFIDGNKRIAHAAMEVFLLMNGYEIIAPVDEQEKVFLNLASGKFSREQLIEWLDKKVNSKSQSK